MPAALDFMSSLLPDGWPALMEANHRAAVEARAAWTRCTTQDPESLAAAQARSKLGL